MPRADDAPRFVHASHPVPAQDQPARRQRLRRGRLRRRAAVGDERAGRCAVRIRHPPHRHAGDPRARLAGSGAPAPPDPTSWPKAQRRLRRRPSAPRRH